MTRASTTKRPNLTPELTPRQVAEAAIRLAGERYAKAKPSDVSARANDLGYLLSSCGQVLQ